MTRMFLIGRLCLSSMVFVAQGTAHATTVLFVETVDTTFNRYRVSEAIGKDHDAAKLVAIQSAVVFAALQLTGSEEEKARLEGMRSSFESWEDIGIAERVLKVLFVKDGVKLDVVVKINVKELRRKLEAAHLITKGTDLAEKLGNPSILIAPEGSDGRQIAPAQRYIVDTLASFFTQQKYDLVDAGAMRNLSNMQGAVTAIEGVLDDPIAQIASLIGADIYVTFSAGLTQTVKASASLKAYETTTAKLIASATGESSHYPAGYPAEDAVREAVNDGVPKMFEDLSGYWHDDIAKGRKYLFSIAGDLSNREQQKALRKELEEVGDLRLTVKTAQRFSGTVRAKGSSDDVEEKIEDAITAAGFSQVKLVLSTRQMFIFAVEESGENSAFSD